MSSDHFPILVKLLPRRQSHSFKFEAMWVIQLEYRAFLAKAWSSCAWSGFLRKVEDYKVEVKAWHWEYFGKFTSQIRDERN